MFQDESWQWVDLMGESKNDIYYLTETLPLIIMQMQCLNGKKKP